MNLRSRLNRVTGYFLLSMAVLSLSGLSVKAQNSDMINTGSYNAEIKKIDDEYHDCTRRNRQSPTIQECAVIARKAKNQLALKRQEMERQIIADRHTDQINTGSQKPGNTPVNKPPGGLYGPMNWGLDREDGYDFEQLRYDYEVKRIIDEQERQKNEVKKQYRNCRTSQCRAALDKRSDQIDRDAHNALETNLKIHEERMNLLNKYWNEQDKKPKQPRKYFP